MKAAKNITKTTLLASCLAGMVGSGWLLGPMVCARIAGPASILSWVIGGFLMMLIGACFVLIARAMPEAGGSIRFFQMTYGALASFAFSWITWIAWVAVPPIEVMALMQYAHLPHLMTKGMNPVLSHAGMMVAIALTFLMTWINQAGTKSYARINRIFVFFKCAIPVVTVILIATHAHPAHALSGMGAWMPYGWSSVFAALPLAGVIYSFIGFNPAIQLASECAQAKRAVPFAIFGSLATVIMLYAAIQAAFIVALSQSSIEHGWYALHFKGDTAPFAALLTAMGAFFFVKALIADAVLSPFGTAMVHTNATSRMTVSMSLNGYLPKALQQRNKKHTPQRAMWLNTVIGVLFFMPFPSWQHMVGFLSSCLVLGYVIGPMTLWVLCEEKHTTMPYPRWAVRSLCVIALTVCSCMIYWSGWGIVSKIGVLFFGGLMMLGVKTVWQGIRGITPSKALHARRGSWVMVYMAGMVVISYLGSFGGIHWIPAGWDCISMAGLACVVCAWTSCCIRHPTWAGSPSLC